MTPRPGIQTRKLYYITILLLLSLSLLSAYAAGGNVAAAATPVPATPTDEAAAPEATPTPQETLTAEEYLARGQVNFAAGDFEAAIADFTGAIELDSEAVEAYYWRGQAYQALEEYEQAIADFDQALTLDPDLTEAYVKRGAAFLQSGDFEWALLDLDEAIQREPESAEAYLTRGLTNLKLANYEQALADLDQAIQLDASSAEAYAGRGLVYALNEEVEQGLADLEEALRLDPERAGTYLARGNVYVQSGQYEQAVADFDQAIGLEPDNALFYLARASAHVTAGEVELATADLDKALELTTDPASQERLAHLAEMLQDGTILVPDPTVAGLIARGAVAWEEMNYFQAVPLFTEAIDLAPDNARAYYWRAGAHYALDNYQEAVNDYTQALELNPKDTAAYYWRGLVNYDLGENEQALADLSQAITLDPAAPAAYYWRAEVYQYGLGDYEKAVADYTQAIDLGYSDLAAAYLWRGDAYAKQDNFSLAKADYEQVLLLVPDYASAYNSLCWYGSLLGQAAEVLAACDQAVELEPDSGSYRDSRGLARALTGDYPGAVEDFQFFIEWLKAIEQYEPGGYDREAWIAALEAGQNPFDQATLAAILHPEPAVEAEEEVVAPTPSAPAASPAEDAAEQGFAYMNQEQYDQAIEAFQTAIGLDPAYGLAYLGLGYSYVLGPGDLQQAIVALNKYLELVPDDPDRAQVEADIQQMQQILAEQKPSFDVPAGKALFVFRNYSGEEWNVDIGPYFLQVPAKPQGQEFTLASIAIDPGKYTWQAHSVSAGYYITDQNGNKAFEFTVAAGEVYETECCR